MTDPLEALESKVKEWRHEWSYVADEPLLTHRPSISNRHADELEPIIQQIREEREVEPVAPQDMGA